MKAWKRSTLAIAASLMSAFAAPTFGLAQELTKVTFSLDFIPLGRHAAWYAALGEGYFTEEGLDVTIIPSQGTAQVMQAIASNTAQLGFVDLPGVVLAQAAGTDIRMVAVNYQKAPYAIFSLANGANVTDTKQLEGLTIGSGAGSITPQVIKGFMKQSGLDPASLNVSNVAPPARASALLSGQVPSIEFFIMSKPGLEKGAKDASTSLTTFLMADHGLELYSNGIGASQAFIEAHPDVVRKFVRAALRGWKFTLDNPDAAADHQMKVVDGLSKPAILAEIDIVRELVVTEDTKKNGLGSFEASKMEAGLKFVTDNLAITGTAPSADKLYVEGFLPDEPVKP
ncbi:ABC transporter substrate-binding protein [Oryzicola mucosus]|uniref:ABC transporter substrate-binding protein n=1 Tax=Oryzicola mucosus TaxID=2767425 RepID=A0A8J6PTH4_9HYPH|nr:ABC transporter substrate-binding protein [Oryzicola mucosus]MBD0413896.1 ABC transporter substrate-binding protein [Oryzicola mucosus]